jgi:hypothetical protein
MESFKIFFENTVTKRIHRPDDDPFNYRVYVHNEVTGKFFVDNHCCTYPGDVVWLDSDGFLHNDNGPAKIVCGDSFNSGIIKWDNPSRECYYKHGKAHRLDGPAIIFHRNTDNNRFYIEGVEYTKEDYYSLINNVEPENRDDIINIGGLF